MYKNKISLNWKKACSFMRFFTVAAPQLSTCTVVSSSDMPRRLFSSQNASDRTLVAMLNDAHNSPVVVFQPCMVISGAKTGTPYID